MKVNELFAQNLLLWNRMQNTRSMPWKNVRDPYRIWLSEIMLQQTRVEQGLPYYQRFTEKYPEIFFLAEAPDDEVFKLWEGLGYYSRCRNLLFTARYIARELNGVFPKTYDEIRKLKGVGPYTAAAIASFAYDAPHAVVDGNVYRILSRVFGVLTATDSTEGKKQFADMAQELLPHHNPAEYNQAIMDFGATVCVPKSPDCPNCVMKDFCFAYQNDLVASLPYKAKKISRKHRYFIFFTIRAGNQTLVHKRTAKDIWHNLFTFPLAEVQTAEQLTDASFIASQLEAQFAGATIKAVSKTYTQALTHQHIHAIFVFATAAHLPAGAEANGWQAIPAATLKQYAYPKILNQFMQDETVTLTEFFK